MFFTNGRLPNTLIVVIFCVFLLLVVFRGQNITENFVPSNNAMVGKHYITVLRLDQEKLNLAFQQLIKQDTGKIDESNLDQWRHQEHIVEQARLLIERALERFNLLSGRKFYILDTQSVKKETTFDKNTYELVDRYTVNLFVQEKNKQNVHANVMNISFQFLLKGRTMAIRKMHFVIDHFYKRPLVDGDNVHDRYFQIKNPYHLNQPFYTTEDRVLLPEFTTDQVLKDHHKDLRTPQYRCFDGSGELAEVASNKQICDISSGYWDKPPERDEECPFFRANKNYVNRLGGIDAVTGRCMTPINTKLIGFRYVSNDPAHKPWVANCKVGASGPGSAGPCADDQMDKSLYPQLSSPDFVFPGDQLERSQHWKELKERGLNWSRNPTNTKDISNPNQRQPVFANIVGPGPGRV